MNQLRLEEILRCFIQRSRVGFLDADITAMLLEYFTEAGLDYLKNGENNLSDRPQIMPNFSEIAIILQHSSIIYSRKVDHLWEVVQNAINKMCDLAAGDTNETREERVKQRSKKQVVLNDFKHIALEEASNITMKENLDPKAVPVLPRAFMQFEPRVMSSNDVQLKDYFGETIGLVNDFRVNWNTDENFTLCDDMDFSTINNHPTSVINNRQDSTMLSPCDSGHTSDCMNDFFYNNMLSPDMQSNCSRSVITPIVPPTETTTTVKLKKRKLPVDLLKKKSIANKFDMSSPLTGTAKCLKLMPSEFSIPDYAKKVLIHRKIERMKIKTFLKDVYSIGDMNKTYLINDLSPIFKKRPSTTWSRLEIQKKLKLSQLFSDVEEEKGFSEREDLDDRIFELEKACMRLDNDEEDSLRLSNDGIDRQSRCASRNFEDDDIPEDCYIESSNIFEPSIARRLAEADSISPCSFDEQSDVSKRIEAWHASIQNKLKEAAGRKTFDLKEYSKDIFNAFKDDNVMNLGRVVKDKPSTDVARYFLTTLMLANKHKVVIEQPEPLACGDFQISLPQGVTYDESDESVFIL